MMGSIELFKQTDAGKILLTFLLSMLPLTELRGSIPVGIAMGLNPWAAMLAGIAGTMVPVPFIIVFIRRIFAWLRVKSEGFERLIGALEKRTLTKGSAVNKYKGLGLFIFSMLPVPGAGAWSSALLAALLDVRLKKALPSIFAGVVFEGLLFAGLMIGVKSIFSALT